MSDKHLTALVGHLSKIYDQTVTPRSVREHYDGELRRIKLAQEQRDLIPSHEVRLTMAGLIKHLMIAIETLPDILERDVGIGIVAVERVREICDRERETLFEALLTYTTTPP